MKSYVVYFDKVVKKENKIHETDCPRYLNRSQDTTTTQWSRAYTSIADAEEHSGVTRKAKCCLS